MIIIFQELWLITSLLQVAEVAAPEWVAVAEREVYALL